MSDEWRNDPATEKQKEKLRYFGCTWDKGITKGQASDVIDECVKRFPDIEAAYQTRPATKDQRATLRSAGGNPDDEPGDPLTYQQAKELIEDCQRTEQQEYLEELESEYLIDIEDWAALYPGLTWKRVQTAAKALDKTRPEWREDQNHIDIMLEKVAELNPQVLERWKRKSAPKRRPRKRSRKGDAFGTIVILAVLIWIIYKIILKGSK